MTVGVIFGKNSIAFDFRFNLIQFGFSSALSRSNLVLFESDLALIQFQFNLNLFTSAFVESVPIEFCSVLKFAFVYIYSKKNQTV